MSSFQTFNQAVQAGISTGIRSMTPLAVYSLGLRSGRGAAPPGPAGSVLRNPWISRGLLLAAAAEIVADKVLPLPPRINPGPLGGRIAIGAILGGSIFAAQDEPVALGAAVGGLAGAWGSFAAYGARQLLTQKGLADPVAGMLEDALAIGLALSGMSRTKSRIG